jgi:hypothetical protein
MSQETTQNNAVNEMIRPWLTGDIQRDAKMLKRMFRGVRYSLSEWMEVVKGAK